MKDKIGVLLVQVGYDKDPDKVLQKTVSMVDEAKKLYGMLDIVCMPELYYDGDRDTFLETWRACSRRNHVNIVTGSIPVYPCPSIKAQSAGPPAVSVSAQPADANAPGAAAGGREVAPAPAPPDTKPKNTAYIIDRDGNVIGDYSKCHLFDAYGDKESDRFDPGDHLGIFDLDIGKIGVIICYDIRFTEYIRTLALKGIDVLMIPAAFYRPRTDDWEVLLRAASLHNIMYVCASNQFGKRFAGRSSVADPDGRIVARASEEECTVYHVLDMNFQKHMREVNPLFNNRRPDLYEI